jgi:hypothetical protein
MRLHHIAAFLLVVWYLEVPPPNYIGIPIANWERRGVFDSKAQCESVFHVYITRGRTKILLPNKNPFPDYDPNWNWPQCIVRRPALQAMSFATSPRCRSLVGI